MKMWTTRLLNHNFSPPRVSRGPVFVSSDETPEAEVLEAIKKQTGLEKGKKNPYGGELLFIDSQPCSSVVKVDCVY